MSWTCHHPVHLTKMRGWRQLMASPPDHYSASALRLRRAVAGDRGALSMRRFSWQRMMRLDDLRPFAALGGFARGGNFRAFAVAGGRSTGLRLPGRTMRCTAFGGVCVGGLHRLVRRRAMRLGRHLFSGCFDVAFATRRGLRRAGMACLSSFPCFGRLRGFCRFGRGVSLVRFGRLRRVMLGRGAGSLCGVGRDDRDGERGEREGGGERLARGAQVGREQQCLRGYCVERARL